jgi:hypothetical protein
MSSVSYILVTIALIIPIIIGLSYIFANRESGNLLEYQKSSDYEFAELSHGLTAYKQFGSKDNTPIIVIHGGTLPSEGYISFCEGLLAKKVIGLFLMINTEEGFLIDQKLNTIWIYMFHS